METRGEEATLDNKDITILVSTRATGIVRASSKSPCLLACLRACVRACMLACLLAACTTPASAQVGIHTTSTIAFGQGFTQYNTIDPIHSINQWISVDFHLCT